MSFLDDDFDDAALMEEMDQIEAAVASSGSKSPQPAPSPAATKQTSKQTSVFSSQQNLSKALQSLFGFDQFRDGQEEVVRNALDGRDTAIFWATGRGKSICYQLPALLTRRTVIVISPLISLMTDQVTKLNNTVGGALNRKVAALLGSGQIDPSVEQRAMQGEYQLVYITPEKLCMGNTLDRLASLHAKERRTPLPHPARPASLSL